MGYILLVGYVHLSPPFLSQLFHHPSSEFLFFIVSPYHVSIVFPVFVLPIDPVCYYWITWIVWILDTYTPATTSDVYFSVKNSVCLLQHTIYDYYLILPQVMSRSCWLLDSSSVSVFSALVNFSRGLLSHGTWWSCHVHCKIRLYLFHLPL